MSTDEELEGIIDAYEYLVGGIDEEAQHHATRAYGGVIRAGKGSLVESIARQLVQIAWGLMGQPSYRLTIDKKRISVPMNRGYVERIQNAAVRQHVSRNIADYHFRVSADLHIHIDGVFSIAVECKAFTENAMIKRVLFDCSLLKRVYPELEFLLFQLESQLGGDYSNLMDIAYGSYSTHTLLSFFDFPLNIVTLLEGERSPDEPIHKPEYYKPLTKESLYRAIDVFRGVLEKHK